ncbi:MAG TPA: CBS domain-containing protein [Caldithrix sp.]|nr:CBS domain-containing protein [Caldithrix sp.]
MKMKIVSEFQPFEDALKIDESFTIEAMVRLFVKYPQIHHLCIMDPEAHLKGLIDRKRLFKAIFSHHVSESSRIHELFTLLTSESAADLMIRHVLTVSPDDSIDSVIETMIRENIYEMPVVDEQKKVLGFLSSAMILKEWLSEQKGS